MNEETTKPARVRATPFFLLKDLHAAREEEARAKEAEHAARIDECRAARIEDDRRFIDLGDLRNSIVNRYGLEHRAASHMMELSLEITLTPLFCRWFDPAQPYYPDCVLWAPLPAGPVSRIKGEELAWNQYYNLLAAPKHDGHDIDYPLSSAVWLIGLLPRELAIRREDACRLFGLADHELIDYCHQSQAPAQPQEDATEAQDASAPAGADPEPVVPSAVAVEPDSASAPASTPEPVAQQWSLKKPKRFQGYRLVLRDFLKVAWTAGNPEPPTVQDVLDMWKTCRPHGITRVMPDGFEYLGAKSKTKEADREAIRKTIERLVIRTTSGR